jgi:muramoyltetrapeptide carboxypeptidase
MDLITPPILKLGDTIGIVAPARKVTASDVEAAIKLIKSWGFNVVLGDNLYGEFHQFSGTDEQRASDLQAMISNSEVAAILCVRGGYGSVRLLDLVNLRDLQRNPKWIVGYSDITVFHGILNCWYMMETIHGVMPFKFPADGLENESTRSLRKVLMGESPTYSAQAHPFNRLGEAKGLLTGGNLSILYSLSGTDADITTDGKILFIEDLDEYLYHIDRMMMNLKHSGKLKNLAGLVVGGMNEMNDNLVPFGKNAYEIVMEAVKDLDFPVCFGFPAGHQEPNVALIMGRKVRLTVDETGSSLEFYPPICSLE